MSVRVLLMHNAYQHRGGEDSVVDSELALLRDRGHEVRMLRRDNKTIDGRSRIELAATTVWSRETTREVAREAADFRPDVIHVHNDFPLISPSLYWAAAKAGVPIVKTLHNFRLLCPQAILLRDGRVCTDCVGHVPWRGVVRRCYRGSLAQSAVLAGTLQVHRALGTWRHKITRYIALNEFCRSQFIAGGLPPERIVIKPNFVERPALAEVPRDGLVYVGRLSHEKGVDVLAQAARLAPEVRVRVVGDGPERAALADSPCELLGARSPEQVHALINGARALVLASICHESFPRTLVEAFANGVPVVASRLGSLAELVEDGRTGLLFEPGNPADLAAKMRWIEENPERALEMGRAARAVYEERFTPEKNYEQLMTIYRAAIDGAGRNA